MSDRRQFLRTTLLALGGATIAGCDRISESETGPRVLDSAEAVNRRVQHFLSPSQALAREYAESDISAVFKPNGTLMPDTPLYQGLMKGGFVDYRLDVGGLVEKPTRLSIDELRALGMRTQITRHDCVEGWSAIGKWTGTPLGAFLRRVGADLTAKYVHFVCAEGYSVSIDMPTALHAQTQMTFRFDGEILPTRLGFPMRIRMPVKLGFKNPKHVIGLAVLNNYTGGYWEDRGYNWFSGL